MKHMKLTAILLLLCLMLIGSADNALAEEDVGTIVAIRGKAFIQRDDKSFEAEVRDNLYMNDIVSTREASRAKMLFIDDSVLTIGENSQVVIKEVIYSTHKMGRSVFSLLEGKMRSIVGKTQFEVHTPTAVAAARGTVILTETGVTDDGKRYTIFIILEGTAIITSTEPGVEGSQTLTEGMMIMVVEGVPVLPAPTVAPIEEIERLQNATDSDREISIPGPAQIYVGPEGVVVEPAGMVPSPSPPNVDYQQPPTPGTTPVEIDVIFPNQ